MSDNNLDEMAVHLNDSGKYYFKAGYYVPLLRAKKMRNKMAAHIAEITAANERLEKRLAETWQPVDFVQLADGLAIHVDTIAMTIGRGNMALDTHQWPDDGYEYVICRRTSPTGATLGEAAQKISSSLAEEVSGE